MESSSSYGRHLEQKIYELFREQLPVEFDIYANQRLDSSVRADLTITKEDNRIAIVEVKGFPHSGSNMEPVEKQLINVASLTGFRYAILALNEDKFLLKDCNSDDNATFCELPIQDICKKIIIAGSVRYSSRKNYRDAVFKKLRELFGENNKKIESLINKYEKVKVLVEEDSFYFADKEVEDDLFKCFLEEFDGDKVCRYTSLPSLFRTLNEGKQSMCCIVGMNDRSECTYADNYIKRLGNSIELPTKTPYEARIENNFYILSCMDVEKYNDLTMWRLYGDNTKGVNIMYNVSKKMPVDFKFYKINYAEQQGERGHEALNIIGALMSLTVANRKLKLKKWNEWKHFFKPYEYKDEMEIRLLYTKGSLVNNISGKVDNRWVLTGDYKIVCPLMLFKLQNFPLQIEEIKLGPNCPDVVVNQLQLELMIKGMGVQGIARKKNVVNASGIETYRLSNS